MGWGARGTLLVNHFRVRTRLATDGGERIISVARHGRARPVQRPQPGVPQVWPSPEVPPSGATTWPATATTPPTTATRPRATGTTPPGKETSRPLCATRTPAASWPPSTNDYSGSASRTPPTPRPRTSPASSTTSAAHCKDCRTTATRPPPTAEPQPATDATRPATATGPHRTV